MSDLITQEQTPPVMEIREQTACPLVVVGKESKNKKFSLPKVDISKIVLLLRRYGVTVAMNLVILGVVCLLFFFQIKWNKAGNKVVGRIDEEKVIENLIKKLDKDTNKTARQTQTKENNLVRQEKEVSDSKNESRPVKVDNSRYVIEANGLYEQEDYRGAAAFYEKGLDKSMPFLNEDFVMYRMGDCYLMSGRYEEAAEVFQTLNNDYINSPYYFKSRLKAGECYAGMGEFGKARKTLYTVVAQEGKCSSNDDKSVVVDAYFKIADYYMKEAQRLRKATAVGTGSSNRSLASK
ncbi:MAG: tetratricopeptide repeat protein [Candidatus Brocadiaceae bacterium]|nr:tetratricopeptide repeat protein [Candidatus Brocadiaceae bacterium]